MLGTIKIFFRVAVVFLIYGFVRLLRPLVWIRFGSLYAEKIGPLISLPALYLLEKDHGIQPKNTVDIFCDGSRVCNSPLLKMWKRVFLTRKNILLEKSIAQYFLKAAHKFSFGGDHVIKTVKHGRDILGLIEKSPVYLQFTNTEIAQAQLALERMGIKKDDLYVCMLNRDQRYLSETFPEQNWDYQSFRNCRIGNYVLAAEELTRRGYYVIRMGVKVGELMNIANPKIIEYADRGFRSDLLDIYLCANCHFFIGCNSGLDAVPWFFHRPEVYVNISDLEYAHSWLSNGVMIFKKYWLKNERRFMTVEEMIKSGAGRFSKTEEYGNRGIELIENSPEEILDVIDEMDRRLNGTWQAAEEDEELQANFWSYFKESDLHGVIRSRIGAKFLRQNKELLDPRYHKRTASHAGELSVHGFSK